MVMVCLISTRCCHQPPRPSLSRKSINSNDRRSYNRRQFSREVSDKNIFGGQLELYQTKHRPCRGRITQGRHEGRKNNTLLWPFVPLCLMPLAACVMLAAHSAFYLWWHTKSTWKQSASNADVSLLSIYKKMSATEANMGRLFHDTFVEIIKQTTVWHFLYLLSLFCLSSWTIKLNKLLLKMHMNYRWAIL